MTILQRFRRRLGADYVDRIKVLACQVTEPVIPPLALPAIRPLVAVPAARTARLSRFQKRMEA